MNHTDTHSTRACPSRRGFTLVELMVVVGIIVILLGIGIAVGPAVINTGEEKATQMMLVNLDTLLTEYLQLTGQPATVITTIDDLWKKVIKIEKLTPMVESLSDSVISESGEYVIRDGWGNKVGFVSGGTPTGGDLYVLPTHSSSYFWSMGANSQKGDADVNNNGNHEDPDDDASDNLYSFDVD